MFIPDIMIDILNFYSEWTIKSAVLSPIISILLLMIIIWKLKMTTESTQIIGALLLFTISLPIGFMVGLIIEVFFFPYDPPNAGGILGLNIAPLFCLLEIMDESTREQPLKTYS
ncbi:hypothetical protein HN903_01725 [archaeon]|jgi:hypothetical protein|nr:hypothetical protein [archaeon]MBT7128452.1 hypothetical protein [archaeon]